MAIGVNDARDRLVRLFDEMTETQAVDWINKANRFMLMNLPLSMTSTDVPMVAAQQEYSLAETVARVWSAEYVTGAALTQRRPLEEVSKEAMDGIYPAWRSVSNGEPTRFYIERNATDYVLGLFPTPATSASGGYPLVRLHHTQFQTLSAGGDLPKGILSEDFYVFWGAAHHATDSRKWEDAAQFKALWVDAFNLEVERFQRATPAAQSAHAPFRIPRGF